MTEACDDCTLAPGAFKCPVCGHQAVPDVPIASEIVRCSECTTRIAYGVPMPRVVVKPDETDARFVILQVGEQAYRLDRKFGHLVGLNIVSICGPT